MTGEREAERSGRGGVDATPWLLLVACGLQLAPLAAVVALPLVIAFGWIRRRRSNDAASRGFVRWAVLICLAAVWAGDLITVDRQHLISDRERLRETVHSSYAEAVAGLREHASELARRFAPLSEAPPRAAAFARLEARIELAGHAVGDTFLLVDGSGRAWAWAGPGLRHDLPEATLPERAVESLAGFTAVTLYAIEPVSGDSRRPWRVVAGRSDSNTALPFVPGWIRRSLRPSPATWSLVSASSQSSAESTSRWEAIRVEGAPVLRLRRDWLDSVGEQRLRPPPWVLVGLFLLMVIAVLELLRARQTWSSGSWIASCAAVLVAPLVLGFTWGVGLGALGASLASIASIAWAASDLRRRTRPWHALVPLATAGALSVLYQWTAGAVDLSASLGGDLTTWLLRFAVFGLVFAGVLVASRISRPEVRSEWLWLSVMALGVATAAASAEGAPTAWTALAIGAVGLLGWAGTQRSGALARLSSLAIAAAAFSATLWLIAHRGALRHELAAEALALSAVDETGIAAGDLETFFREADVDRLALGSFDRLAERRDLALALWQASPLAKRSGLSALRVFLDDGTESRYTDGLDFPAPEGSAPASWNSDELAIRSEAAGVGLAELYAGDRPIGVAEYLFLPLTTPGRTREPGPPEQTLEAGELARALLGGANADPGRDSLPGHARLEIRPIGADADVTLGDWRRDGERWVLGSFRLGDVDGPGLVGRIELPVLSPVEALTAVALTTTALLAILLGGGLIMVLLALLRPTTRRPVLRWVRSYPKRLMLVVAVALVVPVGLLDLFLFQSFDRRLQREQRTNGEAALRSAETILADYLPTLEPGFSFTSAIDADLLAWLSRVVSHEVNLYWQGYATASSRPELFAAGILPRRIPGRVFSRLALAGETIVVQEHRVGSGVRYLELYRPIALPGEDPGENGLFLSVPLVAQQAEARRALSVLGQQTVVVTAGILLLLVYVGSRIAASFTTPLMQIVERTDRIARGERSLGIEPKEPELAALTEAIDDMAARVAEARERLLREKQVVDGVVANITSAVVSIGGDDRVQMCNRTATELLGVTPGQSLVDVAARAGDSPLSELLRERPDHLTRRTARIPKDDDEEEWTIVWAPVAGAGDPAALLVVEDVTEVLRGQRLEAWAEMARMIAHEVKNPLTPIRLSAEHLQRVHAESPERLDEVFDRCIDNILAQVAVLRDIAAEFSVYSRIPSADLEPEDLVAVTAEVVESYAASPPRGVSVALTAPAVALVRLDPRLIARAVRNLVQNAVQASGDDGSVEVSIDLRDDWAVLRVDDRGSGVPRELLPRIFEPNFSTTSGGTGLGLPITQRIVEEHGGRIEASNRAGGGLSVEILLPLADTDTQRDVPEPANRRDRLASAAEVAE